MGNHMRAITLVFLVGALVSAPTYAETQLDLSKIENRREVLKERKGMDCGGIYKQTQLKVDAVLTLADKFQASAGLTPEAIVQMNATTTAIGQKRREFCELYKSTPEFNKEEYFRVYGELSASESDMNMLFKAITGRDGSAQGGERKVSALIGQLKTVSVSAADSLEEIAERIHTRVELAGMEATYSREAQRLAAALDHVAAERGLPGSSDLRTWSTGIPAGAPLAAPSASREESHTSRWYSPLNLLFAFLLIFGAFLGGFLGSSAALRDDKPE